MGFLILPAILMLLVPSNAAEAQHTEFERFAKAMNETISIVDQEGLVHEGELVDVTPDAVSMKFGSTTEVFKRDQIARGERLSDRSTDGLVKGAIFGAVMGLLVLEAYPDAKVSSFVTSVSIYGGIGWLLDAGQTNRETLYQTPKKPSSKKAALTFAFRF